MATEFLRGQTSVIDMDLLGSIPLLQSSKLAKAKLIEDLDLIDRKYLDRARDFGRKFVTSHEFIGIAYTQFDPDTLLEFTGRNDLLRMIYIDDSPLLSDSFRGRLFVNPEIIKVYSGYFLRFCGCGSIKKGKLKMVERSAMSVKLHSYLYNPGLGKLIESYLDLAGDSASIATHEIRHLEGKDLTDVPELCMDFLDPSLDWNSCNKTQQQTFNSISRQNNYREWLVYRKGKLIIVNQRGSFIREYTEPGE